MYKPLEQAELIPKPKGTADGLPYEWLPGARISSEGITDKAKPKHNKQNHTESGLGFKLHLFKLLNSYPKYLQDLL
jgi:hypothetical protein